MTSHTPTYKEQAQIPPAKAFNTFWLFILYTYTIMHKKNCFSFVKHLQNSAFSSGHVSYGQVVAVVVNIQSDCNIEWYLQLLKEIRASWVSFFILNKLNCQKSTVVDSCPETFKHLPKTVVMANLYELLVLLEYQGMWKTQPCLITEETIS